MNVNTETQGSKRGLEVIKWFIIAILLTLIIIGNHFYYDSSLFLRILVIIFVITIIGCVAITTNKGKFVITFAREARTEIRKVIWPSYQEALHTTLIVVIATIMMSLILWGLDGILVRMVSFVTGLRF